MEFRTAIPKLRTNLGTALLFGAAASVLYLVVAQFLAVLTEPPFSSGSNPLLFGFAFGTFGVPVALWFRFELRAPLGLLVGILVFWHGFVFLVGSGGDAPLF